MHNKLKIPSKTREYIIYSLAVIILTCLPSIGMETFDHELLPSWNYIFKICEPNGEIVQEQMANNPVYLHGFDILHDQAIKGQNTTMAFLEMGVDLNHLQFKNDQIKIIDCSQYQEAIGQDRAIYRDNREFSFNRLGLINRQRNIFINEHGNHVMGVALSQARDISYIKDNRNTTDNPGTPTNIESSSSSTKATLYQTNHPGGCCPEANGILYSYSCFMHKYQRRQKIDGMSVLSIKELNDLKLLKEYFGIDEDLSFEDYYSQIQPSLTSEERTFINEMAIDASSIKALLDALEGPAFAINWSSTPYFLMNPKNQYKVPEDLLNRFGYLAEANDKIIIFCANNDGQCLEQKHEAEFYKQILDHPILSQRVVFSVNVCPTTLEDENKIGDLCIKNYQIPFKLYYSSNYPGESYKSLCLSAVGTNIISGYDKDGFRRGSGTSEAAPVIASLATLVKQKFPEMTGPQVIQRLKDTALPLGDPKLTGWGYIWAPAALGLMRVGH